MAKANKAATDAPTTDAASSPDGAPAAEAVPASETHTYEDGSQVVGCPPWPEKSPKQRAAELAEAEAK